MTSSIMYHEGNRRLQEQFESRRIADRLEEKLTRTAFTENDRQFIEGAIYFFIATADAEGRPDCSFKGGMPGFVRVTGPSELAFPDYDGNGMFKSLGNVAANPSVGLLFIAMHGKPRRLRVNGEARIDRDDPLIGRTVERDPGRSVVGGILDGLRHVSRSRDTLLVLSVITVLSLVGFNFHVIVPLLAEDTLHVGPGTFGLLSAAFGLGALVGALASAALGRASWKAFYGGALGFSLVMLLLAPLAR